MAATEMNFVEFSEILTMLPGIRFLQLQGEGEPLLARAFFQMAGEAFSRGILTMTTTNGTLMDERNVERIIDARLGSLFVSLESPVPEEFKRLRGFDFARLLAGIEAIKAAKLRRGSPTPTIGFAVTVMGRTKDRLPEIFELHRSLDMDGPINVRFLQKTPGYDRIYSPSMRAELLTEREVSRVSTIERALAQHYFSSEVPTNSSAPDRLIELAVQIIGASESCFWLDSGLYVDADGDLAPCCNIKKHVFRFGHYSTADLHDIYRQRKNMQDNLIRGTVPRMCQGCMLAEQIVTRGSSGGPPSLL
jgi:radical SAM protein with 4Fe4S-binding SPASM domain